MNPGRPDTYVISSDEGHLDRIEARFPDYLKLLSICWLLRIGANAIDGIILTSASLNAIDAARQYAASRGWTKFMIRHDSPKGRARTTQGGFLVGLDEIEKWVRLFVNEGICLLLEPLDPLLNGYNVSCLVDGGTALLEIVGPGFDASDLQRGQIHPHEKSTLYIESTRISRATICSQDAYSASVTERERKIWWKYMKRELSQSRWRQLTARETEACREFIASNRGALLPARYVPMDSRSRSNYLHNILPVLSHWMAARRSYPAVFAGSFVQDGSFRVWDVSTATRWLF